MNDCIKMPVPHLCFLHKRTFLQRIFFLIIFLKDLYLFERERKKKIEHQLGRRAEGEGKAESLLSREPDADSAPGL